MRSRRIGQYTGVATKGSERLNRYEGGSAHGGRLVRSFVFTMRTKTKTRLLLVWSFYQFGLFFGWLAIAAFLTSSLGLVQEDLRKK